MPWGTQSLVVSRQSVSNLRPAVDLADRERL